jgi:hypothetical protein
MRSQPKGQPKQQEASLVKMPGMTPRDLFFYQLGAATIQSQLPMYAGTRWMLAAPDEEARLLGEISLEIVIEALAPSPGAAAVDEHIVVVVGPTSKVSRANGTTRLRRKPPRPFLN